jgi:hypothetical protein
MCTNEIVVVQVLEAKELLPCEDATITRAKTAAAKWRDAAVKFVASGNTVQGIQPGEPLSFTDLVSADMEAYKAAEAAWGGYEEFKRAMDTKVYAAAEADGWTVL